MKALRGTLAFFTLLPVARGVGWQGGAMLPWFPVAGLLIGCLWSGFDFVAALFFPPLLRACLDVFFLIVLTGGLHLDGLADTADGLLSHRGAERALEIMKDSRIGAWGVVALIAVLGLKVAAIHALIETGNTAVALLFAPAYARLGMCCGIAALPYGRGEQGIAHELFGRPMWSWVYGGVLLVLLSFFISWPTPLVINLGFGAGACVVLYWYKRSLSCVTGDMLGALGEVMETLILVLLAAA